MSFIIYPPPLAGGAVEGDKITKKLHTKTAKTLRKNSTDVERIIWQKLRNKQFFGFKFRRQQPVGIYIVDFVNFDKRIVIELDGGQYYSEEGIEGNKKRDAYLKNVGLRVLRFSDREVFENLNGVLERICEYL